VYGENFSRADQGKEPVEERQEREEGYGKEERVLMKGRRGTTVREVQPQVLHIIKGCVPAREGWQIVSAFFVLSVLVLHVKDAQRTVSTGGGEGRQIVNTDPSYCFLAVLQRALD